MADSVDNLSNQRKGFDFIGVSACAIVHDGSGSILMMKRGKHARDEHGRWDITGGSIELGDTIEYTLIKELQEELRTVPIAIEFLNAYEAHRHYKGEKTHWIALLHAVLVDPATVKLGEPQKFDEIAWFTTQNLPSPVHSQFSKALKAAIRAGIIR